MRKTIILAILALFIITPFNPILAVGTDYRYTGKPLDTNTNLYYYGQRYYDPMAGRFTQPDPVSKILNDPQKLNKATGQDLQQLLANPQAFNEYSYTVNNPVRYNDPTGEWFKEYFTGRQSWSSFQGELGEAAMYVGPTFSKAIDHPYITGAVIGVGVPLAAQGIGVLLTKGLATFIGTSGVIGGQAFNVVKEFNKLNKAAQGAYEIAKAGGSHSGTLQNAIKTNMTAQQIRDSITSFEQLAVQHLGRIKDPSTYKKYQEFLTKTLTERQYTLNEWKRQAGSFLEQANVLKGYLNDLTK